MLYIIPFAVSFILSLGVISVLLFFEKKGFFEKFYSAKHRKSKRHIHKNRISRFGGVAIILSFVFTVFVDKNLIISNVLWGIIWGSLIILIIGLWDDFKELSWRVQLFFQTCIIGILFLFGVKVNYITNPFGGVLYFDTDIKKIIGMLIVMLWALILMNAVNWLDGIDGLSGGVSLIAILTIFFLSLKPEVNQPPVAIISVILVGGLLGFLVFNFFPAKIMAGTSGAFFMGFVLVGLSIFAGTKIATTLLVMIVPITDFFWVIGRRISIGKSIFSPGREHLHHFLLEIGWSQKKIVFFFYIITIMMSIFSLIINTGSKIFLTIMVATVLLASYLVINKKFYFKV